MTWLGFIRECAEVAAIVLLSLAVVNLREQIDALRDLLGRQQ